MGICAQESKMCSYLQQYTENPSKIDGVALGVYQCEPITYYDVWDNIINRRKTLRNLIFCCMQLTEVPDVKRIVYDLRLATIMCRCHFLRFSEPLPDAGDIRGQAEYWLKYYNCSGVDLVDQYIRNVKHLV